MEAYTVWVFDEYGNQMKYDDGTDCTAKIVPTNPTRNAQYQSCIANGDGTQTLILNMTQAGDYRVLVFLGGAYKIT